MNADIWENGSDFHYISEYPGSTKTPWDKSAIFYYSGRQAILDLLAHLGSSKQNLTVWLPAYYCGEVLDFIEEYNFLYYDCAPDGRFQLSVEDVNPHDVILLNCYFGVTLPEAIEVDNFRRKGITIIEDHSQDPYSALAVSSQADYCFASLRKTLPLPDGGILWSPIGAFLPPIPVNQPPVSVKRVAAMLAKKSYLNSEWFDKALFRTWFIESEAEFNLNSMTQISEMSFMMLQRFDVGRWRSDRLRNYQAFYDALSDKTKIIFDPKTTHPMGILLLEESAQKRDELKHYLLGFNIYPAILWPVDERVPMKSGKLARDFAARCLFIHCDGRYAPSDMLKIATVINDFSSRQLQDEIILKSETDND